MMAMSSSSSVAMTKMTLAIARAGDDGDLVLEAHGIPPELL
jgi:hypothetical protein